MNDVIEGEIDTTLDAPQPSRPTKRDLVERGLDALRPSDMQPVKITLGAGGLAFSNILEVMDFAKAMATSGKMVPAFLRGNPGGCLGITFQAIHWRMDPFQVAQKSYEVNDRIGFESQLIHAVIEARAPLQHRLDCRYSGEGDQRKCIIIGHFVTGDTREYESPPLIKVKKKSPLWTDDPDQQLFYYASRSWARKWCPDVLMGVYARDELLDNPALGREEENPAMGAPGLHARLLGSSPSQNGHKQGHVESELQQITENGVSAEAEPAQQSTAEAGDTETPDAPEKRTSGRPRGSKKGTKQDEQPKKPANPEKLMQAAEQLDKEGPKTVKGYLAYARQWISEADSAVEIGKRWNDERRMRNDIGVTAEDREPLDELIKKKRDQLEKS